MLNENQEIQVFTVQDVMKILHIGRNRVYDIFKRDDFPAILIGRKYVIEQNAFYIWLQNRREKVK